MNNEEIQLRANHWFWHETLRQEDRDYLEPYITAAEYVDDMYVEEYATVIIEQDNSSGPWVYFNEQKIPGIPINKKTHKEFGFVGKLPNIK
tara:strand:+ start:190 stop:462 length:273 start_codon:yes stop_codon:yes gene_type:complete